ncbi:MAG TPA: hypothetical protein VNI01_15145, partial [Elusimicrobiota bacterium]|nr:hypothetical protein [Elusimicrobiota bacterium]
MAEEAARDLPEPETKPSGKALAPLPATGAQVSIRVVEIRRTFVDLAAAGTEEVDQAAAALKDDPVLAGALAVLARQLQGPVFRRLRPPDSASAALAARELLANPAVRPVLEPGRAQEAAGASVHVRPAARVRATDPGGRDRAVAAEDAVDVSGFVTDPAEAGLLIRAERPGPLSAEVYAACGAYSAGLLYAAVGEGRPPELPGEPAAAAPFAGFVCASVAADQPSGPAALEALAAHTAAAVRFYLSGAAWAVVAAWIAAAARGKPAPAALGESAGPVAPRERAEAPRLAAAWRPPAAQARLVELLERLAHARGAAPPGPDAVRFDGAPFAELQRLDAVGAYRAALVEGRESEELAAFLERAATRRMKVLHVLGLARAADVAAAAQGVKLRIVADKLGAARAVGDPEAILAGLARAERELVEAEFERRRLAWQAAAANRCPHVRLAVRMRRAPSAEEAARAFAELEGFLAPEPAAGRAAAPAAGRAAEPAAGWLLCRSCGHRAIGPHVRDRVRLEARGLPAGALRTRLQRYAVRVSSGDAS